MAQCRRHWHLLSGRMDASLFVSMINLTVVCSSVSKQFVWPVFGWPQFASISSLVHYTQDIPLEHVSVSVLPVHIPSANQTERDIQNTSEAQCEHTTTVIHHLK